MLARQRAILAVNSELLFAYWEIGNTILFQQKNEGWGTKVIGRLIADLKAEFPDMKGLSPRNFKYMRACQLHLRQGKAITNFELTLPQPQSDLATETFKSPYIFDFLNSADTVRELGMEKALIRHIKYFMLELGRGFAYVGNQYHIRVEDDEFFLDMLFFNYRLDCFVVVDLKLTEFRPEDAGKLNSYINAVDGQVKLPQHKRTIGILLCKSSNQTIVKYALQDINSPIGISSFELTNALPKELKAEMPTIEELEQEIDKEIEMHRQSRKK